MTNAEIVAKARKSIELESMRAQGRIDALNLRSRAVDMEGTEIIAEEEKIPQFNPKKDYSDFPLVPLFGNWSTVNIRFSN